MTQQKSEFSHESFQDRESIVRYFHSLSECFSQGKLSLSSDDEEIAVDIPGLIRFDVRAKTRSDRVQVILKMSWKSDRRGKDLRVRPTGGEESKAPHADV
ncbi:MAG TPA: amphi-Trp domain-containing protein [Phycisphaerae bacterium]|nr:amphi-Trp domain-containing protein [Phycisphaerae bacterium]